MELLQLHQNQSDNYLDQPNPKHYPLREMTTNSRPDQHTKIYHRSAEDRRCARTPTLLQNLTHYRRHQTFFTRFAFSNH